MAAKLWNKAPFVPLLTAFITGITLQWHLRFPLAELAIVLSTSLAFVCLYSFSALKFRYSLSQLNGLFIFLALIAMGAILVWLQDVRNKKNWAGHHYVTGETIIVTLEEPLVEKANSYKAEASFYAVSKNDSVRRVKGKLLLYFKKDSVMPLLSYGTQIVFRKPLQEIRNAGNPGSFDYKTYSLFHVITHQAYLTKDNYVILPQTDKNFFVDFIFESRRWVVDHLRKHIDGEKEQGLAEALLIGYKDDLDKNLVQAYSNTGVVHIIAISGLHLGLIYWLLLLLTNPLKNKKRLAFSRFLIIMASLWLFSFLAGAQPSVLRSALMFTMIAGGEVLFKKANIFNTLAFSASVLLCINPFWLWDVGFQLSYAAVLSIILFFQPVYNWFFLENKIVDFFWKMTAVTIAAQILTLPISIYHFHQMPVLFLFTNFIAVPLSSLILFGEIILCAFFFFAPVADFIGTILKHLIYWMNSYIEQIDRLPFAVWNFLSINIIQAILLLIFSVAFSYWLMEKKKCLARIALVCFAAFMLLRAFSFTETHGQRKLIVYNVPKHTAIDIVNGRNYSFIGDTALLYDDFARNFHLQPSRILHRISQRTTDAGLRSFQLADKHILVIDKDFPRASANPKPHVDAVILSKNPRLYISSLANAFLVRQVIIDGSVPAWKAGLWKKDCDSLKIPCYHVGEQGAFVMNW